MPSTPVFDPEAFQAWDTIRRRSEAIQRVEIARQDVAPEDPSFASHSTATLVTALAGVVRVELGPRRVDLLPGGMLAIAPGVRHRHAPLRRGSASFCQGFLRDRSDAQIEHGGTSWWVTVPLQPSRALIERLFRARDDHERRRVGRELLARFCDARAMPLAPPHPAVKRMLAHLRAHRYRHVTAEAIARASGIARSRAFALFRAELGESPKNMLVRDRLALAQYLIRDQLERSTLSEIARRCGFADRDDLGRTFRRVLGRSPSPWSRELPAE